MPAGQAREARGGSSQPRAYAARLPEHRSLPAGRQTREAMVGFANRGS